MTIALILIVIFVVVLTTTALVTVSVRRRRGPELEPPPAPTATIEAPPSEAPEEVLTPEQLAAIEEALREVEGPAEAPPEAPPVEVPPELVKPRFRDRLGKARNLFSGSLGSVRARGKINEETWEDLEEALIRGDVGLRTTPA